MPRHIWLTLWMLSLVLIVIAYVAMYRAAVERVRNTSNSCLSELDASLNGLLKFTNQASMNIIPDLQASNGDVARSRAILLNLIYQNNNELVRFAWLDSSDRLRANSLTGVVKNAVNLSQREYVKQARLNPMQFYISHQIKHIFRSYPIMAVSIGVLDRKESYLGTLIAVMNMESLIEHIRRTMKFCPSLYRVRTPHDEAVTSNVDETRLSQSDDVLRFGKAGEHFIISGVVDPKEITALRSVMVARAAVMMVIISGVIGLIYWLVQRRFIRPMEVALHSIDALVNGQPGAPPSRLNSRLEAMQRLVGMFESMQSQMDESRQQLGLAKQHIALTKQQQAEFFQATSTELSRAYDTIAAYSDYLEDQILLQSLKPDARYDFDDVTEMGIALRQLSDDYVRLCHITPPAEQNHQARLTDDRRMSVSVSQSVANMLAGYAVMIERRNLHVATALDDVALTASDVWSVAALQSLLLLLIQHARDEAHIEITTDENHHVIILLSVFRQSMLPVSAQDFSDFMPSMQRDVSGAIEAYLHRHAFVMIAQSYLAIAGKSLTVQVDEKGAVRLVIETENVTPSQRSG